MGEFELIQRYFSHANLSDQIAVGVGDDCAVIHCPSDNADIAVSKDLLLEGTHFFADADPYDLGYKTLAVNLSDLAAMSATPLACFLGVGLPTINSTWVDAFYQGFNTLAQRYHCPLVGGDTTASQQGIVLSVTVLGAVQKPYALRSAAQVGDNIWISGELGAADTALSLLYLQKSGKTLSLSEQALYASTQQALHRPEPQVNLGLALRGHVHAMIDISDGLIQDLSHILKASHCGAVLYEDQLPVHPALANQRMTTAIRESVLAGGEVYQLCFTASPTETTYLKTLAHTLGIRLTCIGHITAQQQCLVLDSQGQAITLTRTGFDHFHTTK